MHSSEFAIFSDFEKIQDFPSEKPFIFFNKKAQNLSALRNPTFSVAFCVNFA